MQKSKINKIISIDILRHSYATHLLGQSNGIRYIQEHLVHNNIMTTFLSTKVSNKNI